MSEEEQRDFNEFSLASVSVPASTKRPWRAQGHSEDSQSQAQDVSIVRQARPQAVAKAQSVKFRKIFSEALATIPITLRVILLNQTL